MNNEPWWVEGARVHRQLETLETMCLISRILVQDVDNIDGFCLREQLWHDGLGVGFNTNATRMFRQAAKRMNKS